MDEWTQRRARMVEEQIEARGIHDPDVLAAMRRVPREDFVPEAMRAWACDDSPLSIGDGQTISQPYIVARMTEALLEDHAPRKVLEVGTGCGYQAAVLAPLVITVYSVERIAALQQRARRVLRELRIANVHMRHGDGFEGWPPYAPYDGILVAAAAMAIPPALLEQLGNGGRLIMPVGPDREQKLMRVTRRGDNLDKEVLGPVTFVPLLQGLS